MGKEARRQGGKEYYLQERRQGGPHSEYKSKDAQNTLLQTLESATPPKKKIIKQLWNKNQEKRNVI